MDPKPGESWLRHEGATLCLRENSSLKTFYLGEPGLGGRLTSCARCIWRNRSKEGKGLMQGHPDRVRSRPYSRLLIQSSLVEKQLLWAHVGGGVCVGGSWAQNSGEETVLALVRGACRAAAGLFLSAASLVSLQLPLC